MDKLVKITIDGKEVEVPAGMNLIDAAETVGIHIPNLCYLKGMKGIGACRMCLVEIEGLKAPVIACNTKVKEGMIVHTKTDKIQEIRKFVIDLILSMHPLDCMTCTKAGICNLQKYAYEFELKESSFMRKKFGYPTDEANPFIKRDPEYCILCGRCVRICKEQGTSVLDFMGRGIESRVVTANNKPLQESGCTFCGSCLDACPVNALLEADRWRKGREWEYQKFDSVCLLCGNSCSVVVSTKDERVQKINSGGVAGSAEKYICAYGRFWFDSIDGESRILKPMKREDGKLVETTWDEALRIVAERLKKAGKETGFLVSGNILNEDVLALKKFAQDVVKTRNIGSTVSLYADDDSLIKSQEVDINKADLILLVGLEPSQWQRVLPALDVMIRRRVNRNAKLIVINEKETKIGEIANINLVGNELSIIKRIVKRLIDKGLKVSKKLESAVKNVEVTEAIEKAVNMIMESNEFVIFSSASLFDAVSNIALMKGKIVLVPLEGNSKGVTLMGVDSKGKTYKDMVTSKAKVIYAIGNVPLNSRPDTDFLIVQNSHLTDLAKEADIVLPSTTFFEESGTIVDYMGKLKYLSMVIEPYGESKSHREIFMNLAKSMGANLKKITEAEVKKAFNVKAKLTECEFVKRDEYAIDAAEFIESINSTVINSSRLLWLKEGVKLNV